MPTTRGRIRRVRPPRRSIIWSTKGVIGWGSECVGTDAGSAGGMDPPFPAHTFMHKANRYGLASLCQLDKLPPKGAILIAAPLKIVNGTGSPLRVLALVPKH